MSTSSAIQIKKHCKYHMIDKSRICTCNTTITALKIFFPIYKITCLIIQVWVFLVLTLCFIESCWTLRLLITGIFGLGRGVIIQAVTYSMQVSVFKSKSLSFTQVSEAGYLLMAILVSVIFFDLFRFSYLFLFAITACSRTFTEVNIPNTSV